MTHVQHDYITSPTEDDFYAQIHHLNDQIDQIPDGITPPSSAEGKRSLSMSPHSNNGSEIDPSIKISPPVDVKGRLTKANEENRFLGLN